MDNNKKDIVSRVRSKYPGAYDNIDDETLYGAIIKKYPVYSNSRTSENILQKAIHQSRIGQFGGSSITAALPSSGAETMDIPKVLGRQIPMTREMPVSPLTMGPMAVGFNMAGINKMSDVIPAPETEYGKNLESSADIAQLALPVSGLGSLSLSGAKGIGKGVGGFFKALRGKKIPGLKANIKSATEAIGSASAEEKNLEIAQKSIKRLGKKQVGADAKEFGARASKTAKDAVQSEFQDAKLGYRKMIEESNPEEVGLGELNDVLDRVITNKGIGRVVDPNTNTLILDPSESALINLKRQWASKLPQDAGDVITMDSPKKLSRISDIKNFKNQILRAVKGREDIEADFLSEYARMLEEKGLSAFNEAGKKYSGAYSKLKASKKLTGTAYEQIAMGRTSPTKYADIESAEKQIGINQLEDIIRKQNETKGLFGEAFSDVGSRRSQKASEIQSLKESIGSFSNPDSLKGKLLVERLKQGGAAGLASTGIGWLLSKILGGRPHSSVVNNIVENI